MDKIKSRIDKDGTKTYYFDVYLGVNPRTGKKSSTTKGGFRTEKAAERKYISIRNQVIQGTYFDNAKPKGKDTFEEVYKLWLETYEDTVKPSTLFKTKEVFKYHIIPAFGNMLITKIKPPEVQLAINKWAREYVKYKTLINYASKIFNYAKVLTIIKDNPFEFVIVPKQGKKKPKDMSNNFYDIDELAIFMTAAKKESTKVYLFFRILAYTGMRRGEALALRRKDISFPKKTITIKRSQSTDADGNLIISTPKEKASYRTIDVDDRTLLLIKKWIKEQNLLLGQSQIIASTDQLLFQNNKNLPIYPSKVWQWYERIRDRANLRKIDVHGFRHTHASLLFLTDPTITVADVQARLGHADSKTTMDYYVHSTKEGKKKIADSFASYIDNQN